MSRGDPIEKLAGVLTGARKVAVLSGAGLSAESGVPTFRGKEGLWKQRNPVELATPEAFRADHHVGARSHRPAETTTSHLGFRCAYDKLPSRPLAVGRKTRGNPRR